MYFFKSHGTFENHDNYIELNYIDGDTSFVYIPHCDLQYLLENDDITSKEGSILCRVITWTQKKVTIYSENRGDASIGSILITLPNHPSFQQVLKEWKHYMFLNKTHIKSK